MNRVLMFMQRWLETSTRKQKWTSALTVIGLLCTLALLSVNGGAPTPRDSLGSTPLYFAGAFVKLVVVLFLILVSAVLARRWLQPGMGTKKERQMHLMESVRLSPKQALHLVSVGDQQFLIGATDQNVALIAQVESSLETAFAETTPTQAGLEFGTVLQSLNVHWPGVASK